MNLRIAGMILKAKRQQHGWTLQDVSDKTKLTKAYLSQIESGKSKNPSINSLMNVCSVLGVSFYELVADTQKADIEMSKKKRKASLCLSVATS